MTNSTEETLAEDSASDVATPESEASAGELPQEIATDGFVAEDVDPENGGSLEELAVQESATEEAPTEEKVAEEDPVEEAAGEESSSGQGGVENEAEAVVAGDNTDEELVEAAPPQAEKVKSPYDRPGRWYVLHTQSGYENKVKTNLLARTQSMNMESRIFEVVIPLEDVVEFKNGKKVVVQKKVFPGYLLCRLHLDDDSWFVVRNTPGVTGFAGAGNTPVPMRRSEVEQHLGVKDEAEEAARKGRPRLEYGMGETVRVKEGPFADFQGEIVEINEDQLKVKVLVNIFGRETPVELEFAQVGKV